MLDLDEVQAPAGGQDNIYVDTIRSRGDTPMSDATLPRDLIDRDKDGDEQRREERNAAIDNVLMRLVARVLEEAKEAADARARGGPQDPTAPLDHMIDVLDDVLEARRALDRLYTELHRAADGAL